MSRPKPLVLIILDGWGLSRKQEGNAIQQAHTPYYHHLLANYPVAKLEASGEAVGLPEGQMGNSEVGHLNIGAGRVVYQDLTRITKAIKDETFFTNPTLLSALEHVKRCESCLHLMGLVSDGGVHSHIQHLFALLELAKRNGIEKVYIHAILDGRDVGPKSARTYLTALEEKLRELNLGAVASVVGRYYTMDRDRRWERVELAYRAMVRGEGEMAASSLHALENAYEREETDEFVRPTVIVGENGLPLATINSQDAVIFFNFRPDRARQITRALTDEEFAGFDRGSTYPLPYFVCFTQYDETIKAPVAFPPEHPRQTFGEVIAAAGLKQLRIAETEKYAHVTFFFSGGSEVPFPGEDRILVPSPKVPTYNLQPEMSAPEVTDKVLEAITGDKYDVIILNYANTDMVGHTGIMEAAIKAVETIDSCLQKVVETVLARDGIVIVTADHGNAEQMLDGTKRPFTAHTANPVPFILVAKEVYPLQKSGSLPDIAPTMLDLLGLPIPPEMTGTSLLIRSKSKKEV
ncbi:MAG: 2,3-bisphosphoglycerate-independent phosphoglycerate mutase [Firmicutes bacterium]|nr:2,3-bisphosphoglycerate-independent phosphoglycerate mutase [Bacillota bacterium]